MYQNCFYEKEANLIHIWDDVHGYYTKVFQPYGYVKSKLGNYTALDGVTVEKIYDFEGIDRHQLYESDVPAETRTLIDLYHESDEISTGHREVFIDIEVSIKNGYSDAHVADNAILAISLYNKVDQVYSAFLLDPSQTIKPFKKDKVELIVASNERDLLYRFLVKWQEINPTIISGWNSSGYDIPYMYNRLCRVMGQKTANKLSPIGIVIQDERSREYRIAGVSHLDYMELYKQFNQNEEPTYTLDYISKKELGRGKVEYDGDLEDLYMEDKQKYITYNLVDVELLVALDNKLMFIELAKGICHKGHVQYEEIYMSSRYLDGASLTYLKNIGVIATNRKKSLQLKLGKDHKKGETRIYLNSVIDSKIPKSGTLRIFKSKTSKFDVDYLEYKDDYFVLAEPLAKEVLKEFRIVLSLVGAYVKAPTPGRYEWVYDFDLQSLYPSLIMTMNISPETKMGKIVGFVGEQYVRGIEKIYTVEFKTGKKQKVNHAELAEFLKDNKYSISANGVFYRTDTKGLIPTILETWFDERVEFKNKMKEYHKRGDMEKYQFFYLRQWVQKILLNSFYGVLGLPSFRFYDLDNASAVTESGQQTIKFTAKMANYYHQQNGIDGDSVLYIDTDSCYISALPLIKLQYPETDITDFEKMTEKILEITKEVQTFLNKAYDTYALKFHNVDTHKFFTKQETIAKSIILLAKKRYAQWIINKEGVPVNELDVKGLDVVRSDFPPAFKVFMSTVLKDILNNMSKADLDKKILDFRDELKNLELTKIMLNKAAKDIGKYDPDSRSKFTFPKGAPAHVKAAITFNDMLDYHKLNGIEKFKNGDKIKWAYLRKNPFNLESMGLRGYKDPKELVEFVRTYIDYNAIFEASFSNKLDDFYSALGWGSLPSSAVANDFFDF